MFTSPLSPQLYQELMNLHYSRRLLLNNPVNEPPRAEAPPPTTTNPVDPTEPFSGTNGFDANVVLVLSVLLCALICSLGLNSIIRCAIRCSSLVPTNSSDPSGQLANKGIKKKALKTFAIVSYSPDLKHPSLDCECVICLSEFAIGEKVRILPKCHHGFHVKCIDKWLNSHSSCPTCRHCLIETCQKIVGCDQAGSSRPAPQPQPQQHRETITNIAPVEREDQAGSSRPAPQQQQTRETILNIAPLEREDKAGSSRPAPQPQPQQHRETIINIVLLEREDQAGSSRPPPQPQPQQQQPRETIVNIAPLEREDLVPSYRGNS